MHVEQFSFPIYEVFSVQQLLQGKEKEMNLKMIFTCTAVILLMPHYTHIQGYVASQNDSHIFLKNLALRAP